MKHLALIAVAVIIVAGGTVLAQTPVSSPLSADLGVGGGVSLPTGDLSDANNTGWHALAKIRLHGSIPVNIVGTGMYSRLPNKIGSESNTYWMAAAGIEYPIPSAVVKPYFGVEAMYVNAGSTAAGSSTLSRGGLGFGAGVEFSLPGVGSLDTSVKYQMLNLMGKDANENTYSQIAASVALMFGLM